MKRVWLFMIVLMIAVKTVGNISCSIIDDRTLTERLFWSTKGTIFTCKWLSSESNPKKNTLQITALVTEVFFGSIDRDTIILTTGTPDDDIDLRNKPKDTIIKTNMTGNIPMLVYTVGSGHIFSYGGTGDHESKGIDNGKGVLNELDLLRQFSSIIHNKKSGNFRFYNSSKIIVAEGNYKKGSPVGDWKHYYDDGTLKTENDIKHKMTKTYTQRGLITSFEQTYKDSTVQIAYRDGLPKQKILTIRNDNMNLTEWTEYSGGGRLQQVKNFLKTKSKVSGSPWVDKPARFIQYYGNGNIKADGFYIIEKVVGLWKFYNEDGSFDYEYEFK